MATRPLKDWKDEELGGTPLDAPALEDLETRGYDYTDAAIAAGEAWHEVGATGEPAFANGWVNFGFAYGTAAFRNDPFGTVHLKGMVKSGTLDANIYVLPVGYRPAAQLVFVTLGNNAVARIDVDPDGGIAVSQNIGANTWTTLSGITFKAA